MFNGLGANIAVQFWRVWQPSFFCIVPPLFLFYGERIRKRSRFERYSGEIQEEMGKDDYEI